MKYKKNNSNEFKNIVKSVKKEEYIRCRINIKEIWERFFEECFWKVSVEEEIGYF